MWHIYCAVNAKKGFLTTVQAGLGSFDDVHIEKSPPPESVSVARL